MENFPLHYMPMIRSSFHIGFDTSAQFYIPKSDQPPSFLSGMVLTLSMEFVDPTAALTYFSKKEDVDKVHELISESVDWSKDNQFGVIGSICDWHVPGRLDRIFHIALIYFGSLNGQLIWKLITLSSLLQ